MYSCRFTHPVRTSQTQFPSGPVALRHGGTDRGCRPPRACRMYTKVVIVILFLSFPGLVSSMLPGVAAASELPTAAALRKSICTALRASNESALTAARYIYTAKAHALYGTHDNGTTAPVSSSDGRRVVREPQRFGVAPSCWLAFDAWWATMDVDGAQMTTVQQARDLAYVGYLLVGRGVCWCACFVGSELGSREFAPCPSGERGLRNPTLRHLLALPPPSTRMHATQVCPLTRYAAPRMCAPCCPACLAASGQMVEPRSCQRGSPMPFAK